ncbi:MAG: hypothetical protein HZC41_10365 [Chloroflexi bacterium]|nr:hypothetical protein [Chloroflexota bacterium]
MNRRKNQNTTAESQGVSGGILTVGLDIGYGVTKVVTDQTAIAFLSVAGHAREIKFHQEHWQQNIPATS